MTVLRPAHFILMVLRQEQFQELIIVCKPQFMLIIRSQQENTRGISPAQQEHKPKQARQEPLALFSHQI